MVALSGNRKLSHACWLAVLLGATVLVASVVQPAHAQIITYRIHLDILAELQDRYPKQAAEYWVDVKEAIRGAISEWTILNPNLAFTPTHTDDSGNVIIEWIDADYIWGAGYHDSRTDTKRIGIDFDTSEPDEYGASLMNPSLVQYVTTHELGHVLGLGHSSELGHLMYGTSDPKPDRVFDDKGYSVPRLAMPNYENVGGDKMEIAFQLTGYNVSDIEVMDIGGEQYVVAATGEDGLHILNMSNPDNPRPIASYNAESYEIESVGEQPYIILIYADGFRVLDISNPAVITLGDTVSHKDKRNPILDATVVEINGKAYVLTASRGLIQQYDVSDPYDIQRSGTYYDDFSLLGVKAIREVIRECGRDCIYVMDPRHGVEAEHTTILNDDMYVLVDDAYDGTLVFAISGDRNPTPIMHNMPGLEYDSTVQEIIEIDKVAYHVSYKYGQLRLHEIVPEGEDMPVGRLFGYEVHEIDSLRVNGNVYAVVAAGMEGILGIHIGNESTGMWTWE